MNLENAAYAILGLFGVALGLFFLINGFEGSGGDEQVMMGTLLMFVGFYSLNSRFFRIGQWEDGENAEPQISENIIGNLSPGIIDIFIDPYMSTISSIAIITISTNSNNRAISRKTY